MKQLKLFKEKTKVEFGGSLNKGKRKEARPLNFKLPLHLVLKATNSFLLLKNKNKVEQTLRRYARRAGTEIYEFGVHADHIHVAAHFKARQSYLIWIRAVSSVLVQQIRGLKWRLRPYTRISAWGKAFNTLKSYIWKNRAEGELFVESHLHVETFALDFWRGVSRWPR
jgi:REP element-mobilizing transposase RayT